MPAGTARSGYLLPTFFTQCTKYAENTSTMQRRQGRGGGKGDFNRDAGPPRDAAETNGNSRNPAKEREADDDDEEITRPLAGLLGNYPLPMTAPRLPHPAHHPSSYNYSADYKDKSFTTEGGTTPLCGALFRQPAKLVQLRSTWTGPHYRDMPREDKNAERTWQDILGYSFAGLVVRYSGRDAVFIEIKEGVKGPNGNKVNVPPHLVGATLFGHIADFLRRDEFPKSEEGADICSGRWTRAISSKAGV